MSSIQTGRRTSKDSRREGPSPAERVLFLAPSEGLGGGIERYIDCLQSAIASQGLHCDRISLHGAGARAHIKMLKDGRSLLRLSRKKTRLIVCHRALMWVATILACDPTVYGSSVVCHGCEVWDARLQPRRTIERYLLKRSSARIVAVSSFTAGMLARDRRATVLKPALSQAWFDTLVAASSAVERSTRGIQLVTAFRLEDWRQKGLPQLLEAIAALRRQDVRLVICGSGEPPPDLLRLVSAHSWCTLRPGLSDKDLALQFARADLFILATRTRIGAHPYGEGFGLVLLEAQVAGTPVIAPAHGGSADAYLEGITGAAPADETPQALSEVICHVLDTPFKLAQMAKVAAEWAREAYAPGAYSELVVRRLL